MKYFCKDCKVEISKKKYLRCRSCGTKENWKKPEFREKHIMRGENHPMFGKNHSDIAKEKMSKARKGVKKSKEHAMKIGLALKGKIVSAETRAKLSIALSGKKHTEESNRKRSNSLKGEKCFWYGKHHSEETKRKLSKFFRNNNHNCKKGEEHYMWKGGISPLSIIIRQSGNYIHWRKEVFSRDNHTCQDCKVRGGYLEAHHKIPYSVIFTSFLKEYDQFSPIEDKETLLRLSVKYKPFWDISNGETLCKQCHRLTKEILK